MKLFNILLLTVISISAVAQPMKLSSAKAYLSEFNRDNEYSALEKARGYIDEVSLDPKTSQKAEAWMYRGIIYMNTYTKPKAGTTADVNNLDVSIASFQKALELDPKYDEKPQCMMYLLDAGFRYYNIGIEHYKALNFIKAFEGFEKTKDLSIFMKKNGDGLMYKDPKSGQVSQITDADLDKNIMICTSKAGMTDKAIELMNKQIAAAPTADLYQNLIELYKQKKDEAKTLEVLATAQKAFPNDVNLLIEEINIGLGSKNSVDLEEKIKKAIALDPNNSTFHLLLGNIYDKKNMLDEAKASFEKVIAISPQDYNAHFNLAVNYNTRANNLIARMNSLGKSDADNKSYESLKVERNKYYVQAKNYIEKAEKIKPGSEDLTKLLNKINVSLENK